MPKKSSPYQALHRGPFCKFPFRLIYYYGSNKSTGKDTGKTHLCALVQLIILWSMYTTNRYVNIDYVMMHTQEAAKK